MLLICITMRFNGIVYYAKINVSRLKIRYLGTMRLNIII